MPDVIAANAKGFLEARMLPSYPRSTRPRSDDKRVAFFAKVLAGFELGVAPAHYISEGQLIEFDSGGQSSTTCPATFVAVIQAQ